MSETKHTHLTYTVEECEQLARTENTWLETGEEGSRGADIT